MKKNPIYIKSKLRFSFSLVIIFLLFYFSITILLDFNVAEGSGEVQYVEICVKPGDTLWELSKSFSRQDRDLREVLYEITLINELESSDIYPGQIIKIPTDQNN